MSIEILMKSVEKLETQISAMSDKADGELKTLGLVSADTKTALDNLSTQQREFADRMLALEQKGTARQEDAPATTTWGAQFVGSEEYKGKVAAFANRLKVGNIGLEVKNTITNTVGVTQNVSMPGVVPGPAPALTLESLYNAVPTSGTGVEFTRENTFINAAAETAEGAVKPESTITFTLVQVPNATIAHWIKISRQLAGDAPALAAYVNLRMRYGVDRRVETQLATGNGTAPNISGFMTAGNFTAHGYTAASLGAIVPKLVLIRRIIGDLQAAGYTPNAIVVNPADWAQIEIDIFTAGTANVVPFRYDEMGRPVLFGLRVVTSVGMTADQFAVGDFAMAGTIHNREGVIIEMSDSDGDNFVRNLVTIRAERRLALANEVPAAIRGGDLTPA